MVVAAKASFVEFSFGMSLLRLGGKRPVAGKDHAVLLSVLVPVREQLLNLVGIFLGNILGLARIALQVVELPGFTAACALHQINKLPVALPHSAIAEKFPAHPILLRAHC